MRVKWWRVPRGLYVAAVLVGVLAAGTASAAGAEAEDYDAEDCREVGDAHYERGEYEEALEWYERGLALDPEDVYLYVGKAEALYGLERLGEALAYYDRALELTPDDILPDYEEERILAIFAIQPFPWILHKRKADILAELGRRKEAIESYDQALKFLGDGNLKRKSFVYKSKIKVLKEAGALEEALEKCDDALARDPADKSLYSYRVELLTELGRYDEAARTLARAAEMGFEDADSYVAKFIEYAGRGEYEKGALYSGAALALKPNDRAILILNGWALLYAGKYDGALECADRALALDAAADAWGLKGVALLLAGEAEAGLGCLDRALELDAEQPTVHLMRGAVYLMQDKYAQARAAYESCLAFDGYEYVLLYLYIVDRADGRSGVERLGPLLESQDDPWGRDIARFLAGEIGAEDLLATAGDDKTLRCEGHCYVGYKNKLDGDAAAARRHFEEAVAAGARHYVGYILSEHELRRLDAAGE
jgi:tetratricopeptide (TPR) repeat protein